jgi:hypothetical protein
VYRYNNVNFRVFFSFFCAAAIVWNRIVMPAWTTWSEGKESGEWRAVEAKLVGEDSPFDPVKPPRLEDDLSNAHLGRRDTFRLDYEYEVEGRRYRAQRYSYSYDERVIDVRDEVRQRVRRGDDGQLRITAHVDPSRPHRATIVAGAPRDVWYPFALGAIIQSGTFHLLRYALRFVKK